MRAKKENLFETMDIIFKPKNNSTLRPEFCHLSGTKMKVQYGWTMDDDDPNPGQIAFIVREAADNSIVGLWIPEEDVQPA